MKCKQCGGELTEWQRSRHVEFIEMRYRCDICGWETADLISLKEPKEQPSKKKNIDDL